MGNEWIDFVKRFAREHQMSYTQALKEAGPAYRHMKRMVGGGLDDLPEELKKEVGKRLTDQELGRLNVTSSGMDRANASELEDRRLQLEAREMDSVIESSQIPMGEVYRNPQAALDRMDIYYRTFTDVLDSNPFLNEGQKERLNEELDFLERQYGQIRRQFNL